MHGKGDPASTRKSNRRFILDLLRRESTLSRVELAQATGLSGAAVSMLIAELIDEGLISEGLQQKSSGGRRPIALQIDYASRLSIGVKIMSHSIEAVLTDLATNPIRAVTVAISEPTPEIVAAACRQIVTELVPDATERNRKLIGMGMGLPGMIDTETGVCLTSHRFGWKDLAIASIVQAEAGVPVWIDNDVNAYAIAQQLFGHGRTHRSIAVFVIGTGLGAALISNSQIIRGARFAAGEIGFCRDPHEGADKPSWGSRFSEPALIDAWQSIGDGSDLEMAAASNPDAVRFLKGIGCDIGERFANLATFVDPELVIVSGEAIRFGPALTDAIRLGFERQFPLTKPEFVMDWQSDYWTRGAAALVVQGFFSQT
jgi:predicted NBD/HSP70 family sugar kinase